MTNQCSACGTGCSSTVQFCPGCGIRLGSTSSADPTATRQSGLSRLGIAKRGPLTSQEASAKSRAYWATLSPTERRIRTLRARIGVGKAAERELNELLAQLQDDGAEGGPAS